MVLIQRPPPTVEDTVRRRLWQAMALSALLVWLLIPENELPVLWGNQEQQPVDQKAADSSNGQPVNWSKQTCRYRSRGDLSPEERYPKAGGRHQVDPPSDTQMTLVCCHTTQGPWTIVVHHAWAPWGTKRFVEMVKDGYFSHRVPLFRCVERWLCQFGLAGEHSIKFASKITDDPNWLPGDKEHRIVNGVRRFQKGYFAYAGSGPNTRGRQLFVALGDSGSLGAGGPWEVPWGELVGEESYEALDRVYTGYGENGPSQELLLEKNGLEQAQEQFPAMDWITECNVLDEWFEDEEQ